MIARNRALRRAELSFGGAWTAEWAFTVALGVVAFRHGGATAVGVVTFLRAAPAALFAPLGAALGDRFPRHRVLVWCCTARGLAKGAPAAFLAAHAPKATVYSFGVVATAAFVVIRPVHSALLPMLCSSPLELTSANVVRGLIDSLSTLLGPLVAALLLEVAGAEAVFAFAAALCVWSGVLVVGLSYERPARHPSPLRLIGLVNETADGFRALRRHRQAATVTSIAVAQVFTRGCLNVFLVVIAFGLLDTGDAGVGVLTAAIGAGAVIGSLAVAAMVTGRHLAALEGIGVTLWGLPLVFCAVLPTEPAVLVSMGIVGVGNSLVDVGVFSLPPRFVPEELLARVFGAFESLAALAVAVGSLITPAVISLLGIRGALVVLGLVAPICVAASWPRLRAIDASTARRDEEIDVLRRVPMLRPLPMPAIENLASFVVHVEFPAGKHVVQQGEPGDSYYVIEHGEAEVVGDGTVVRSMGPGDGFGEIALLRRCPRTATVRARTDLSLYRLDRGPFLTTVAGYASTSSSAEQLVNDRLTTFKPPRPE
ncbi:MAG: MFS transporter [Ilumatobacteraceae bacterium]